MTCGYLSSALSLGVGFSVTAGRVCAGFPRSVVGGDGAHGLVGASLQSVQAGRSAVGFVLRCECLCVRRRVFRSGGFGSDKQASASYR